MEQNNVTMSDFSTFRFFWSDAPNSAPASSSLITFPLIQGVAQSTSSDKDVVNPEHYKKGKVECIDAIESATVGKTGIEATDTGNVLKYLWRFESKNGLTDVKKALWYLNHLIAHLESKNG
jgi:hypothetical protein